MSTTLECISFLVMLSVRIIVDEKDVRILHMGNPTSHNGEDHIGGRSVSVEFLIHKPQLGHLVQDIFSRLLQGPMKQLHLLRLRRTGKSI
jgi:hypothetical protein